MKNKAKPTPEQAELHKAKLLEMLKSFNLKEDELKDLPKNPALWKKAWDNYDLPPNVTDIVKALADQIISTNDDSLRKGQKWLKPPRFMPFLYPRAQVNVTGMPGYGKSTLVAFAVDQGLKAIDTDVFFNKAVGGGEKLIGSEWYQKLQQAISLDPKARMFLAFLAADSAFPKAHIVTVPPMFGHYMENVPYSRGQNNLYLTVRDYDAYIFQYMSREKQRLEGDGYNRPPYGPRAKADFIQYDRRVTYLSKLPGNFLVVNDYSTTFIKSLAEVFGQMESLKILRKGGQYE